jgi:N-methylhydantoinase A
MPNKSQLRIGADVGGTFTDLIVADANGTVWAHKLPSTPPDFEQAVLLAIGQVLKKIGVKGESVTEVAHGTTVATNAVLERRGARTALITTRGFRDVLELRRIRSPQMYDLFFEKPKELVERHLRFEITERISAKGEVLLPLAEEELWALKEKLSQADVQSLAVCFLHAYAYPDHEARTGEFFRKHLPQLDVSLSSEVLRERKEYERTATTVVNSYVRPVMRNYLQSLHRGLETMSVRAPLLIMQSSGGLTPQLDASERPVYILESGPAAGVLAAAHRASALGLKNVITFDMGGTTAKASMIENETISYSPEYEVGASLSAGNRPIGGGGELIRAPSVDIAEVGAGGGSIAYLDKAMGMHVGPRSAGAVPGPACYQRGGTEPTVTDANVVLGYIRPGKLADGDVTIDPLAAERIIQEKIASPLGLSLLEAAEGIHRIANARIMRALRAVSSQRGRDPRDYALMAFGGSGPIHAANLAHELQIHTVIVPPLPGLFSAIGLLSSGVEHHDVRSCLLAVNLSNVEQIEQICVELRAKMLAQFRSEGFEMEELAFKFAADIRFEGQSSEVRVGLEGESLDQSRQLELRARFEHEYEKLYGHLAEPGNPIEIVALRLVGRVAKATIVSFRPAALGEASHPQRHAYFGREIGFVETPVIARQALVNTKRGPLLIDEYDSTTVVPPFMQARIDKDLNIILEPHSASTAIRS